jgi:hypothetical protein
VTCKERGIKKSFETGDEAVMFWCCGTPWLSSVDECDCVLRFVGMEGEEEERVCGEESETPVNKKEQRACINEGKQHLNLREP